MNTKKIIPIISVLLMMLAACQHREKIAEQENMPAEKTDSFQVAYHQPVNGYQVKAVVKMDEGEILYADIIFAKDEKSFILHTTSFGDSDFNKGGWGLDGKIS